jgi:hypothetical protein
MAPKLMLSPLQALMVLLTMSLIFSVFSWHSFLPFLLQELVLH